MPVARRPPPLRDARPRGRAGRPLVVDDPAQARGLPRAPSPASTPSAVAALRPRRRRAADGRPRHRPQPAQGRVGDRKRRRRCSRAREAHGSLDAFLWGLVPGAPLRRGGRRDRLGAGRDGRVARASARSSSGPGFRFVGPTVCYAFMQAVGMVDDHAGRASATPDSGPESRGYTGPEDAGDEHLRGVLRHGRQAADRAPPDARRQQVPARSGSATPRRPRS